MKEKRTVNVTIHLTPAEYEALRDNCKKADYSNMSAYMRKMIFDGYIINVDFSSLSVIEKLLRNMSNNLNQISRRVNSNGNIYAEDLRDIRTRLNEVWEMLYEMVEKVMK